MRVKQRERSGKIKNEEDSSGARDYETREYLKRKNEQRITCSVKWRLHRIKLLFLKIIYLISFKFSIWKMYLSLLNLLHTYLRINYFQPYVNNFLYFVFYDFYHI